MFPWHSVFVECALIFLGIVIGASALYAWHKAQHRHVAEVQRATVGDVPSRGFRGSLSDLGLSAILNMISMEKKSGVLTIWRDDTIGHLTCRGGEVLAAKMEVRRDASGEEAVYALLGLPDGTFVFEPRVIGGSTPAMKSVVHLLMESARRADQARVRTSAPARSQ